MTRARVSARTPSSRTMAGDVVAVGGSTSRLIHTPGHTPGSQCLLVNGRLISGDTLFLDGCGRTDLPGSDPVEMYRTLTQRLSDVSDDTVLFPGSPLLGRPERADARRAPAEPRAGAGERRAVARDVRALIVLQSSDHVVIVGAGFGGWRLVEALRREGFVGAITLVGEETYAPYDRPPLSKQVLAGKWDVERATLATPEGWPRPP